jgi:hypothetical protein
VRTPPTFASSWRSARSSVAILDCSTRDLHRTMLPIGVRRFKSPDYETHVLVPGLPQLVVAGQQTCPHTCSGLQKQNLLSLTVTQF